MEFDENLAAIHGYLCSDGYVIRNPPTQKNKYYYIGFRNTELELLKDFQERFNNYFKVKPRLLPGERCVVQRKELYWALTKKFSSFYSREWSMPKLNKKLSAIWLKAFFDCEGWVYCKSHQNRHVSADSINKEGLQQVKNALQNLGIKCKIRGRRNRNIYTINIFGKENITRFKKKVGFLHPKKKQKLDDTINDFVIYEWNFPDNKKELVIFTRNIMKNKARMKKNSCIFRLISNREVNLIMLQETLKKIFCIESRINRSVNGIGTVYYEMSINKNSEINKLIKSNLINEELKEKWKKLKSRK